MALTDYSIDTSGTPQDVQRRQALADALMKQGADSSPAAGGKGGGLITALNRGLAGALGGYQAGQAQQEQRQGQDSFKQQMAAALGADGKINPQAYLQAAGNPFANASAIGAVGKVQDWQHQSEADAEHKREFGMNYGLQSRRLAHELDDTPKGFVANPAVPGGYMPMPGGPADPAYLQSVNAAKSPGARPMTPQEKQAYGLPPETAAMMTPDGPKTLGTPSTNITTNVDTKGPDKYDTVMGEGLAKSHAALSNGVEDAQARARDLAAMQGAIDAIQKRGGTTGGLGQAQTLELAKTINAGAAALGLEPPVDEKGISEKEFLTKFNRQIAGAQAKGAVGSRVTNFEMSNYLKANPGLEMSITGNQRLIGIQSQIEQRNVAVGNAIREATAAAVGAGKRVNPSEIQAIIKKYDEEHHVRDPVTGQDLTQSYTLPEFQKGGNNPALSADHGANLKKIRVWNPATGRVE